MRNKIQEIISKNNFKVSEVIEKSGLAKSSFYEIMNGNSIPSLANARKISKALDEKLENVFPQ